jgi:hypothetical protein
MRELLRRRCKKPRNQLGSSGVVGGPTTGSAVSDGVSIITHLFLAALLPLYFLIYIDIF